MGAKVAIVCPGRNGDVAESTGFIPFIRDLWGDGANVHWFVQQKFAHVLKYLPVQIRPIDTADGKEAVAAIKEMVDVGDFDHVYHTAPWMNWDYVFSIPLPQIPRWRLDAGTGILKRRWWYPTIKVSDSEKEQVAEFMDRAPPGKRLLLETSCFSNQGEWTDDISAALVDRLKGFPVVYVCASFGYAETMKKLGVPAVGLDEFNFRQLAAVWEHCDMYVGVPSGTASVTCAGKQAPRVEFLTPERCPKKPGLAPDWGTASMSGAYSYSHPGAMLARTAGLMRGLCMQSPKDRRRFRRQQRRKRRGAGNPVPGHCAGS